MDEQHAWLVADLGFGDAGKGSCVDFLVRAYNAHTVVRYNGGAQAGHNVVTPDGRQHVFAQFGSGTFVPGVRTHLSRYMLVNPVSLLAEEEHLSHLGVSDAFQRTTIDEEALIITPFHQAANRLREYARGKNRHGSCGMGIGETMADALRWPDLAVRARDLVHERTLRDKLGLLRQHKWEELRPLVAGLPSRVAVEQEIQVFCDPEVIERHLELYRLFVDAVQIVGARYLHSLLAIPGSVVFEGAQGVLLDEWYGFHPYTTWSTTTFANAERLLSEADYEGRVVKLGLTRAYATRHGAGPFVTEDEELSASLPDTANGLDPWQGGFRVGWLDLLLLQYAHAVIGQLDVIGVTNLDRLETIADLRCCTGYQYGGSAQQEELANFFRPGNEPHRITGLRVSPRKEDLVYQEQLGRHLLCCRPIYQEVRRGEDLLPLIEHTLGVPVGLISRGPRAGDKEMLPPLQEAMDAALGEALAA